MIAHISVFWQGVTYSQTELGPTLSIMFLSERFLPSRLVALSALVAYVANAAPAPQASSQSDSYLANHLFHERNRTLLPRDPLNPANTITLYHGTIDSVAKQVGKGPKYTDFEGDLSYRGDKKAITEYQSHVLIWLPQKVASI